MSLWMTVCQKVMSWFKREVRMCIFQDQVSASASHAQTKIPSRKTNNEDNVDILTIQMLNMHSESITVWENRSRCLSPAIQSLASRNFLQPYLPINLLQISPKFKHIIIITLILSLPRNLSKRRTLRPINRKRKVILR